MPVFCWATEMFNTDAYSFKVYIPEAFTLDLNLCSPIEFLLCVNSKLIIGA